MLLINRQAIIFWLLFAIIYFSAGYLQSTGILNSDVSWLTFAAKRFLQGGTYTHDFFELNPPMSIYLYLPAALSEKLFSLNAISAIQCYLFFCLTLSLLLCFYLNQRLFKMLSQRTLFNLILAVIFLIYPYGEFGQREHLLLAFFFPYLLLTAAQLQGKKLPRTLSIGVSLLAGIGFAIKPYFLVSFIFIEAYSYFSTKKIRREAAIISCVIVTYLVCILVFNPDYITQILPIVSGFYYQKFHLPWMQLMLSDAAMIFYFSALLFCLTAKDNATEPLTKLLLLAATGFYLSFILQKTNWFYHKIPLLSTCLLLNVILFGAFSQKSRIERHDYAFMAFYMILAISYLFFRVDYVWLIIQLSPWSDLLLVMALFAWLSVTVTTFKKAVVSLSVSLAVGFSALKILPHTIWLHHVFLLVNALMILFFLLVTPPRASSAKIKLLFTLMLGMSIFLYPVYLYAERFHSIEQYKKYYFDFLHTLKKYSHQTVYYLSNSSEFGFPSVDYLQQQFGSRFAAIGWLPEMGQLYDEKNYPVVYAQHAAQLNFLISALAEDINHYQPQYIFVDVKKTDPVTQLGYFGNQQINYVKFFSFNQHFNRAWQAYHYVQTIDGQPFYKFAIYAR